MFRHSNCNSYLNGITSLPVGCGIDPCFAYKTGTDLVRYNGANLPCSGIDTCDSLTVALQKIDAKICPDVLVTTVINALINNSALYNLFCNAITGCTPTTTTTSSTSTTTSSSTSTSTTTSTSSSTTSSTTTSIPITTTTTTLIPSTTTTTTSISTSTTTSTSTSTTTTTTTAPPPPTTTSTTTLNECACRILGWEAANNGAISYWVCSETRITTIDVTAGVIYNLGCCRASTGVIPASGTIGNIVNGGNCGSWC